MVLINKKVCTSCILFLIAAENILLVHFTDFPMLLTEQIIELVLPGLASCERIAE